MKIEMPQNRLFLSLPEVLMFTIHRTLLLVVFFLLTIPFVLSADENRLSVESLIHLESVSDAVISPDGETIAYVRRVQRSPDEDRGSAYSEMFVVPAAGGEPKQFTFRPHNVVNPQWSPDAEYIYFRSHRPEVHRGMQVYRISSKGGEAEIVTKESSPVLGFALSPDGNELAYIVQDPEPDFVQKRKAEGDDWRIEDEFVRHRRVHIMNPATGESNLLTSFDKSVWNVVWSPDGNQLLVQASPFPDTDHMYMFTNMYLIDRENPDNAEKFVKTEGKLGRMEFSPDGSHIAWHGAVDISDPTDGTIFAANISSREMWTVTPDFDGTVKWLTWADNNTLIFTSEEKTWTRLSSIPYRGGERTILFDEKENPEFTSSHFAHDRRTFVAVASTFEHPNEVFAGHIRTREMNRITYHNTGLHDIEFQQYEYIEYEARDGLLITGLLLKPANYREGERYPLICQIHGGPEAAYTHGWNTSYAAMTQLYSQHGFMVFLPNYRASTGRRVEFAKANHRDGGGREFTDVIDGVEYLAEQGLIDRDRVGIVGGSYGGYFANLAATRYAGNFTAAVSWVGISNQFSKVGITDTPLENILVHFDRAHYQNEHRIGIMEASPIWYLERAVREENETPLLILHGETDARVPYGQAVELYNSLKLSYKHHRGMTRDEIPVTFVSYPRAGHGTGEVRQQLHFSHTVLAFFKKHLKKLEYTDYVD